VIRAHDEHVRRRRDRLDQRAHAVDLDRMNDRTRCARCAERRLAKGRCDTDRQIARGPARLAVALDLDLDEYGADLVDPAGAIVVHLPPEALADGPERRVLAGPRVGVSGAGGDAALFPWRYWLADEPTVSAYRAVAPRRR
jgi:DNA-3-methyladenine glycosylase